MTSDGGQKIAGAKPAPTQPVTKPQRRSEWRKRRAARIRFALGIAAIWAMILVYNMRWFWKDGNSLTESVKQRYEADLARIYAGATPKSPVPSTTFPLGPFVRVRATVTDFGVLNSGTQTVKAFNFRREVAWDSLFLWTGVIILIAVVVRFAYEQARGHLVPSPFAPLGPALDNQPLPGTTVPSGVDPGSVEMTPSPATPGVSNRAGSTGSEGDRTAAARANSSGLDRASLTALLRRDVRNAQKRAHQLDQRSMLLLLSGIAVAVGGIGVYVLVVQDLPRAGTTQDLIARIARSFGLLIFIEGIAWFLLRQHRALLQEHRSFYSLYIKRMNHLLAVRLIPDVENDLALRTLVLTALLQDSPAERLAAGESTPSDAAFSAGENLPLTTALKLLADRRADS